MYYQEKTPPIGDIVRMALTDRTAFNGTHWTTHDIGNLADEAHKLIAPFPFRDEQQRFGEIEAFIKQAEKSRSAFLRTPQGLRILRNADPKQFMKVRAELRAHAAKIMAAKRHARNYGRSTRFAA